MEKKLASEFTLILITAVRLGKSLELYNDDDDEDDK